MAAVARESQVVMRASDEEKATWVAAAKADGFDNLTQWFRHLAKERIKKQKAAEKRQDSK